jgi:methylated-DNA-[protein]-cysteine S-methyltransferase
LAFGDEQSLTGLYMDGSPKPDWIEKETPVLKTAREQLRQYFAGELTEFTIPLNMQGTEFQKRVWTLLCEIPHGATWSYGEMAKRLGNPGASRAVGLANGQNPISIIVPCHRVIGSDGSLTGYGGGLPRKKWLLEHEKAKEGLFA